MTKVEENDRRRDAADISRVKSKHHVKCHRMATQNSHFLAIVPHKTTNVA